MPNDNKYHKLGAEDFGDRIKPGMDLLEMEKSSLADSGEIEATADIDRIEQKMSRTISEAAMEQKSEHQKKVAHVEGFNNTNTEKKTGVEKTADTKKAVVRRNSTSKTVFKVFGMLFGIVVLVVMAYGLRIWLAYNGFLDKVTGGDPETKEYSVVVLANSNTNEIHELERKNIGFLETDPKAGNAEQHLQSVVKFEASFYDSLGTLASVLNDKISDAVTIESNWLQALEDESKDAMKDTRVIYTFEIKLDEDIEISSKDVTKEPFVVLLSGTDSRAGVKATARSDVNIVGVVNPEKAKILLVSIPRDTYVQLHGTTGLKDKLTHAGVYGVNMSKNTIEDFLGIQIDDTVKVSFDTVVKVVDQLDGITIDSDQEMSLKPEGKKDKTCHYIVGKQEVDGDCALRFARERKSYTTGDRHRGENQQQVITAIIDKLAHSKNYVLKLPAILDIAADSFETSMSKDAISSLIRMQLIDNPNWKVESIAIDGTGTMLPTYSMGANLPLYVMIPSDETIVNAQNKITEYLK
ncbi:LCP family protein [Candidatus Saccharibacteria bacterium]|nr:LCP family protein [Candidatus Saccharibacteria bacterium]